MLGEQFAEPAGSFGALEDQLPDWAKRLIRRRRPALLNRDSGFSVVGNRQSSREWRQPEASC